MVKNINPNKKTKSIVLSISIVPKSFSTGTFSTFESAVHLEISPPLGIKRLVKYNIATAAIEFFLMLCIQEHQLGLSTAGLYLL